MSRFRVLAAGMAVGITAALLAGAPAFAHDELVESSPIVDQVFEAAPTEVSLTFSGDVMTMGAIVVIVDESGRDWVDGELAVTGTQVEAAVRPGMPEAGYEVRWRVVSSDGHPISGVVPFTIGDAQPFERETSTPTETDAGASGAGSAQISETETSQPQSQVAQENGALRTILIGAGGAVAAIAVFTLITLLRRRTRSDDTGTP